MHVPTLLALSAGSAVLASASPAPRGLPSVTLDQGTFTGAPAGLANKFLGIPFAQPPTGNLRFNLPVPNAPYTGAHDAGSFGPACPQQAAQLPVPPGIVSNVTQFIVETVTAVVTPFSEDCLTVNVWTPADVPAGAKLPVVVWIFGGGFEFGGTSMYDGGVIVSRSVEMGTPVVYVSMNYRLSAFGFLAGQEVKDAGVGNLGLQDQRQALRWVQQYIPAFGGDPTKVTIWGESAGAISVALQLLAHNGAAEGLFRGAFMQSGSPTPVGDVARGQADYDALVARTGCAPARDTLQCLRGVPFAALLAAVDASPSITSRQSLALAWMPRADGVFLADDPQVLVQQGRVADVPFVTGDCDDEGTIFALSNLNITTDTQLRAYLAEFFLPHASAAQLDTLLALYPADPAQGAPFGTGALDALSPQYKRLAALLGDLVFQAPRRFFAGERAGAQRVFAFLNKRLKATPGVGSAHGTDLLNVYGGGDMADYLIHFVVALDPNGPGLLSWPAYSAARPQLLTFLDGPVPLALSEDTFRAEGMSFVTELSLADPL
ncbi:carotenoid ester lipase precursor [Phanerochaete sordida]|uniref:Carboxylic ester hydrolase n=1 Tax=Phanerochaete sordida TaxID=48140 RepID=A0A9P3LFG4_9APHY|nr:carotenoid ester lipase precursor [Phanerochaete sordida]